MDLLRFSFLGRTSTSKITAKGNCSWRLLLRPASVSPFWLACAVLVTQSIAFSATSPPAPTLTAQADPTLVYVGVASRITVTATLSSKGPLKEPPAQVPVYRLEGNRRLLGVLRLVNRSQNSANYSGQIVLNEANPGTVYLQVGGQPADNLGAAMFLPTISNALPINVVQKSGPAQTPPGQNNPPIVNNGSGGFAKNLLGAAIGAFAGSMAASLITKHGGNSQGQAQPPDPKTTNDTAAQQPKAKPVHPHPNEPHLQAKGLSVRYPAGWNFSQHILDLGGPIALRNFSNYLRGGVIPGGGAEIEITSDQSSGGSLEDLAREELGNAGVPQVVDGQSALRVYFVDEFAPTLSYESIAVYVPHGELIYKFFLSYRAGDPQRAAFLDSFDHVLASARFQN